MKLQLIFAAILAFSLAETEDKKEEVLDDSEAEASVAIELLKEGADLKPAASSYPAYVPPSQRPSQWNQQHYVPPQNTWLPPKEETKPIQPIHTSQGNPPSNVQNDYYWQWSTPNYHPPTTTTPVSVIKNEHYIGDNGNYKYEYQIADGTHVSEEGYFTNPKQTEESIVKKGWYSFVGADGKTYTVTYWADKTGFHAYGDHLPTPPPVPAAIQAALDKEKEADKFKPQYDTPSQTPAPVYYPTPSQTPAPVYYPTQTPAPVYYPTPAPVNNPPQQPTYVPTQPPQQPTYQPSYPSYPPQNYYPQQQQPYYPPQQNYYSQQPTN